MASRRKIKGLMRGRVLRHLFDGKEGESFCVLLAPSLRSLESLMVCLALNASPKSYTRRKAELLRSTKSANCLQLTLALPVRLCSSLLVDNHCSTGLLYGLAAVNDGLTLTTATGLARFERVL